MKENNIQFAKQLLKMNEEMIQTFGVQSLFELNHTMGARNFYASLEDEEEIMNYLIKLVEEIEHYNKDNESILFDTVAYRKNFSRQHFSEMILNLLAIDPKLAVIKKQEGYPQIHERL